MVNHTRLDCLIGSATSMRWGVVQAVHHARHRAAFGGQLADQPLMQNVLADLAIESEAATAAAMRVARAYDEGESAFRRLATAVMKHWVCKRAPWHATEALECLGGNSYVEESGMPGSCATRRSTRSGRAPATCRRWTSSARWRGTGDAARLPGRMRARPWRQARSTRTSTACARARRPTPSSRRAAWWATCARATGRLLVRHAPAEVSDAFCASRLEGAGGRVRDAAGTGGRRGDRRPGTARLVVDAARRTDRRTRRGRALRVLADDDLAAGHRIFGTSSVPPRRRRLLGHGVDVVDAEVDEPVRRRALIGRHQHHAGVQAVAGIDAPVGVSVPSVASTRQPNSSE